MHPLLIPAGFAVALIGLFWPEKESKHGEVSEDGSKRSGGDNGGKPLSGDPESDGRQSQLVKPNPKPKKEKPDVKEFDPDHAPAIDLRGDQSGDSGSSEPDASQGSGEAEPVTADKPPAKDLPNA